MATVSYQIGAGADDGQFYGTTFSNAGLSVPFGFATSVRKAFFRFTGVTIPDGATINSAKLSFYYVSVSGSPPACTLRAVDEANPSAISGYADGDGRSLTASSISVTSPADGTWWDTSDISDIIEELLSAYSYAGGSAMEFIVTGSGSVDAYGNQRTYNGSTTNCAILTIDYTAAAPSSSWGGTWGG